MKRTFQVPALLLSAAMLASLAGCGAAQSTAAESAEPTAQTEATAEPTATPAPTAEPTATPAPAAVSAHIPQTSDDMPYTLLVVTALASLCAAGALFMKRRSK